MKLDQSFDVSAPVDRVWAALIDIERVAPCLPGAAVTGRNDDGSYNGTFSVKIGPTSASYTGKLTMVSVDENAHIATMEAHGTDKRGQGGADATIVSTLRALGDGGTRVEVSTDYRITGRLARFGRGGMIEDISEKLLRQFASCLQVKLSAEPPKGGNGTTIAAAEAEPPAPAGADAPADPAGGAVRSTPPPPQAADANAIGGLSLLGSVIVDRIKRNPLPAAAVLLTLLLLLLRANRAQAEH
jgi:carbon monoxide dehydrogenase subunit G